MANFISGDNRNKAFGSYFKTVLIFTESLAGILTLIYIVLWIVIYKGKLDGYKNC